MTAIAAGALAEFARKSAGRIACALVYGEDAGAVREICARLVTSVAGSIDDPFAVLRLHDADLAKAPERLAEAARAMSLGGGPAVVWVTEAGAAFLAAVAPLLRERGSGNLIVAEAGPLVKKAPLRTTLERSDRDAIVPCYEDSEEATRRIVEDELRGQGVGVAPEAMRRLLQLLNGRRLHTRQEARKLALYCGPGATASVEDVDAACDDGSDPDVSDVIDAVFGGELERADIQIGRLALADQSGARLLSAALQHAHRLRRFVLDVAGGESPSSIVKSAKPQIFFKRVPAIERQLNRWDMAAVDRAAVTLAAAIAETRVLPDLEDAIAARALLGLARGAMAARR